MCDSAQLLRPRLYRTSRAGESYNRPVELAPKVPGLNGVARSRVSCLQRSRARSDVSTRALHSTHARTHRCMPRRVCRSSREGGLVRQATGREAGRPDVKR